MGYTQSESVAEHTCTRAAQQAGIRTRVLRVGQADYSRYETRRPEPHRIHFPHDLEHNYYWRDLPGSRKPLPNRPSTTVGRAVAEMALSDAGSVVANVTNPGSFRWTEGSPTRAEGGWA
jgi:hypothetical protein